MVLSQADCLVLLYTRNPLVKIEYYYHPLRIYFLSQAFVLRISYNSFDLSLEREGVPNL